MNCGDATFCFPSPGLVRQAVLLYVRCAYGSAPSPQAQKLIPPEQFDAGEFLMSALVERDPANAPPEQVRSFVLRLGNPVYPHMKLRISRPPRSEEFVFSVDAHDAFLSAKPGTSDYEMLEQLKKHNAALAETIIEAWEAQDLPTERSYLRRKLQQAREQKNGMNHEGNKEHQEE